MAENNPFACFTFKRGAAREPPPKRIKTEPPVVPPPPKACLKSEPAAPELLPESSSGLVVAAATARAGQGLPYNTQPQAAITPVSKLHSCSVSKAEAHQAADDLRLREYRLIQQFRTVCRAPVDEFHKFLVSLRGSVGRYWALVASILSVQCRDVVALAVVRKVMASAPNGPSDIEAMGQEKLEELCKRCNYYKTKVQKLLKITHSVIVADGIVPESYEGLIALPGVGPKIAHLMRSVAFGHDETGIVVDCHVNRVARLLEWVNSDRVKTAEHVREALQQWVPSGCWIGFTLDVVGFGQVTRMGSEWWVPFLRHVDSNHGADSKESILAATMVAKINTSENNMITQAVELAG